MSDSDWLKQKKWMASRSTEVQYLQYRNFPDTVKFAVKIPENMETTEFIPNKS